MTRTNDSAPAAGQLAVDQLAVHLRSLGSGGLARLLADRPDACTEPAPRTVHELAERLLRPGSVQRAVARLSLPCAQVAEALAALPTPCPRPLLAAALGVPEDPGTPPDGDEVTLDQTLERLAGLGLAWTLPPAPAGPEHLAAAPALRGAWDKPLGLDNPLTGFETVVGNLRGDGLDTALHALGLETAGDEQERRAVLLAHHRDPDRVRALVAAAPRAAQDLLKRLAEQNSPRYGVLGGDSSGDDWAAERALLCRGEHPTGPGGRFAFYGERDQEVPAEVLIALRGPAPAAPFHPRPPAPAPAPLDARAVDAAAAAAAAAFLDRAAAVLRVCAEQPPQLLEDGGIGLRELTRITRAAGCPPTAARLVLECAQGAGLLARDGDRVAATTAYDPWTELPPGGQYARLALAWRTMRSTPTRTELICDRWPGRDTGPEGLIAPLAGQVDCDGCLATRTGLLTALAALPARRALDAAGDLVGAAVDLVAWHVPAALSCACTYQFLPTFNRQRERDHDIRALAPLVGEAQLLGLLALDAPTPLARAVLPTRGNPAQRERELARLAEELLPQCDTATLGPDLDLEADGFPSPRLTALLGQVADRAAGYRPTRWHLTPASLRRALDGGLPPAGIEQLLRDAARTAGIPAPMADLIRQAAADRDRVRLTTPASVLTFHDPAQLTAATVDPRLAHLGLRTLAPTVATSDLPGHSVMAALRGAGHTPVLEGRTAAVRLDVPPALPRPRRLGPAAGPAVRPRQNTGLVDGTAVDTAGLAELLLRGGEQPAAAVLCATEQVLAREAPHLDPPAARRLAHALERGTGASLTYATGREATQAGTATYHLRDLELDPPYLYGSAGGEDEEDVQSFHLSRIRDVDTEAALRPA
ncbi:helicase-associated domain-containing protein [Kitasatospora sp. NPDC088783]|uniref:helicase-associated domain-containing protein n=1 Tax=Kitasatospora sp. NPDC088783 TaxID=3364077 RepID=UPI00380ADB47